MAYGNYILKENIWFAWSKTSYSGDKWIIYVTMQEDKQKTIEYRATQPMEAGG